MKTFLICCFLLVAFVAGSPEEAVAEPEDEVDSGETTEPGMTDDDHCEEVEKLKNYYCTTAHCKHFYSKHCYDIVDGVHPTCEQVQTLINTGEGWAVVFFRVRFEMSKNNVSITAMAYSN